jgi:hypothetical protein
MPDPVVPKLGAPSFSCPHCGAVASQTWYRLYLEGYAKNDQPLVLQREIVLAADLDRVSAERRPSLEGLQQRVGKNEITYDMHEHTSYLNAALVNACVSQCYACDAFTFWIKDRIWFPLTKYESDRTRTSRHPSAMTSRKQLRCLNYPPEARRPCCGSVSKS